MLKIEIKKDGKTYVAATGSKREVLADLAYTVIRMSESGVFTIDEFNKALAFAVETAKELEIELKTEDTDTCQKVS